MSFARDDEGFVPEATAQSRSHKHSTDNNDSVLETQEIAVKPISYTSKVPICRKNTLCQWGSKKIPIWQKFLFHFPGCKIEFRESYLCTVRDELWSGVYQTLNTGRLFDPMSKISSSFSFVLFLHCRHLTCTWAKIGPPRMWPCDSGIGSRPAFTKS